MVDITEATQAELEGALGTKFTAKVNVWITDEAPALDALIKAGDVAITSNPDDSGYVVITFNTTPDGDRAALLKMLAGETGVWHGATPDPKVKSVIVLSVDHVKQWAARIEAWNGLW